MRQFPPDRIRNVALVGHSGVGKTTLAEALLHRAGATNRLGRVEDGTTVCDNDPEEHKRGVSISMALAPFEWRDHKINLIDTPGYADFVGEVHAALRVADLAVFVVSAVEGVEVQTEIVWHIAADLGLPRMVFVNKLDRERADFDGTLDQLRTRFGAGIAPLELPIGQEADFRGVADLLTDTAWLYADGSATKAEIPDDMADQEHRVHDNLVEGIVVADDELMERYLEGDIPSVEQLEHTLHLGVDDATVFPVVCGSALAEIAVDRLADYICEIGPSPLERPATEVMAGDTTVEVEASTDGQPLAFVFKTVADPYVGRISLFKVLSGQIRPDDHLVNSRTGDDERLHGLLSVRGAEQENVSELVVGDIGAVAKLAHTRTGDTLAPAGQRVTVTPIEWPEPLLATAISARTQADEDKLATALHRLADEDPTVLVERDDEIHQTVLRGQGEAHLTITLERLERKFGVQVDMEPVHVAYRETISKDAEAEGRYKKQSGGHGQFGVANLKVTPLARGEGFRFVDKIVGGAIPRQFIPAVQKGVEEALGSGVLGHPVVDLEVTCFDGKAHSVDSSEMSFKMAGTLGLRAALDAAGPVLLEPVSRLEVTMPVELQGDVMGDLNSRRGQIQGTETGPGDGEQTVVALVPTAEVMRYAIDLRSITGGRGRFRLSHDHYDVAPPQVADRIAVLG
ncbi:MAG TPA: elongation factor G [Acidimicrobiales bacterium]|jgi:elongation factor G|nr:elongation factor G [Acidimicrobiales bacterium]